MGRGYKPLTSLAVITFNALVGCHVARPYLKTPRRPATAAAAATFAALQLATMKLCCHHSSIAVFCLLLLAVCRVVCLMLFNGRFPASCSCRGPEKFRLLLLFSVRYADIKMV